MVLIPAEYYHNVYLLVVFILCIIQSNALARAGSTHRLVHQMRDTQQNAFWWVLTIALFIGLRPISETFADMVGYANGYNQGYFVYDPSAIRHEPVWLGIQSICYNAGLSVRTWFLVIAIIMIGLHYKACRSWFGNQIYPAMLFMTTGFYYWSNMTVIIRSGTGSAIALFAISMFMKDGKWHKLFALLLMVVALYTHASSVLISVCFLISFYFVKNIKWSIGFWIFCVIGSVIAGGYFESLFAELSFDDRMSAFTTDVDYSGFSHAGFRWDFLLYSIMPIILGWFVTKRNNTNRVYTVLLNTYILCNAFWVLVIRAQFSDRFAGLSWIIYPIVIAYPLLKMEVWSNQPKRAQWALLAHVGFIIGMYFIYYGIMGFR